MLRPPRGETESGWGREASVHWPAWPATLRAPRILNCTWTPGGYKARFVKGGGLCDSLLA